MKNQTIVLVIILFCCNLYAQNNEKDYLAKSEAITITIGNDSIAAYGMFAKGKQKKETVILLHGLPGHERSLDLAQELRRHGRNVIYFNYRGAWGSQGEFLYSHCVEDVGKVIDFLSTTENSNKYKIKPNSFVLIGHSMGGGIALLSGANNNKVKKIAIYSPFVLDNATEETLNNATSFFKSLFMLNINLEHFKKDILSHKKRFQISHFKKALEQKHLLIFDENERNKNWISQLENAEYILMKTDHAFSSKRLELIDHVLKWID